MRHTLSVVGLGKLGACMAACFGARGFDVLGYDVDADRAGALANGQAPVSEPGLQAVIDEAGRRLQVTDDLERLVKETDVTFLVVPTPSREDGQFSTALLTAALEPLARALRALDKPDHLFVITSTVSPGTIESELVPCIAAASGRALGQGFSVAYSPQFIALGRVVADLLNPDLVLIGAPDPATADRLETVLTAACDNQPPVRRMSLISAEIAKLGLNSYVTMKISFANMLATLCEATPGADLDAITEAIGADSRVGPGAFRGGLPFGGPCFPRDNRALAAFAATRGEEAPLAAATDRINGIRVERLAARIIGLLEDGPRPTVAIVGMTYKPDTDVIEESASVRLVESLVAARVAVIAYDPAAGPAVSAHFGDRVTIAKTLDDAVRADVLVAALNLPELAEYDFARLERGPVVVDCWRALDPATLGPCRHVPLGIY